eukprot:5939785-Amphidinium_carterae.1
MTRWMRITAAKKQLAAARALGDGLVSLTAQGARVRQSRGSESRTEGSNPMLLPDGLPLVA